jgi:hypothetical protein
MSTSHSKQIVLHSFRSRVAVVCLVVFALASFQGCGGEAWHAATYPASGNVSINGKPPEGLVVELHSVGEPVDERQSRPWAVTDSEGNYELTTYQNADGAPAGEYAVVLRWPPSVNRPSFADRLGGKFSNPDTSDIQISVTSGTSELAPIVLDGVAVESAKRAERGRSGPPGPSMGLGKAQ